MRKLWTSEDWEQYFENKKRRIGLYLRFEKGIDTEIKRACKDFCKWLRLNYCFPIRITIYFKESESVISKNKERFSGLFWGPFNKNDEPYIKIATGDIQEIINEKGKDNGLGAMLFTIAHELSHYFQWIKDIDNDHDERQAKYYSREIVYDYAEITEHP